MSTSIKERGVYFLKTHHKTRQWAWFILLWSGGLLAATAIALPIKILIKFASAS